MNFIDAFLFYYLTVDVEAHFFTIAKHLKSICFHRTRHQVISRRSCLQ